MKVLSDSVAEWSKASDSSSDGAIRVGSNPTAVTSLLPHRPICKVVFEVKLPLFIFIDTVAEWLRRRPAKPMCSARVGSNTIGVECFLNVHLKLSRPTLRVIELSMPP